MQLDIQTPRAFAPLLFPNRYKGAFGGRGSAKSHFFGESLVEKHVMLPGSRSVCIREVQKSLEQSSKKLIEDKIKKLKVQHLFRVLDDKIITPGNGIIIFAGMQNHTADSIKSLESFGTAWVDEAQALSRHSLKILRPTIRAPGSEIWFSWNPAKPSDPVDDFFRGSGAGRKNAICVEANWRDNPWFPPELEADRQEDLRLIPEEYDHIWEGGYITITESLIFKGRVSVEPFETPANARFHFGADFGFARDPSTLIRAWLRDKCLWVDFEAGGVGIEMDAMAALYDTIPGSRRWPIKADCSRPETINHVKRFGFAISAAKKWPGSIEDGIAYLKGFERIIIHPRCTETAREFRTYSYKVDGKTEEILPIVVDRNNHYIDAVRYSQDGLIRGRGPMKISKSAIAGGRH